MYKKISFYSITSNRNEIHDKNIKNIIQTLAKSFSYKKKKKLLDEFNGNKNKK